MFITILIAVSLSMDAFSLAVSIGTMNLKFKKMMILSLTVGIFHYVMPSLGFLLGIKFLEHFNLNTEFVSGIIFLYIAIQMIKEYKSEEVCKFGTLVEVLLFGLAVSIDSFGVGFTYNGLYSDTIFSFLIFSVSSFLFTFFGLFLGKTLKKIIGKYAVLMGFVIMLFLSILNFVKFCSFN